MKQYSVMKVWSHVLHLFIYFVLSRAISGNQATRDDISWRRKKTVCERGQCSNYVTDENMNCVNECTSTRCYLEVYESSPLEDGEIDHLRSASYIKCLRNEEKELRIQRSKTAKEQQRVIKDRRRKPTA